jgi:hypothetical protein
MLAFQSMKPQNFHPSDSVTHGRKDMMAGEWRRGRLGRPDVRDALDQSYLRLTWFSNPVSEFPLTYHSELIDEHSVFWAKGLL